MHFMHNANVPVCSSIVDAEQDGSILVKVKTIDEMFGKEGAPIAVIKTDTEGWDLKVLKGAREVLGRTKWVVSEVCFPPFFGGHQLTDFEEVNEFMVDRGFSLYGIYDYSHRKNGAIRHCNAMWVNLNLNY
jgi:hypothetical protein